MNRTCVIDDCARTVSARGLCAKHYQQARREGWLPAKAPRQADLPCFVDGCSSMGYKSGLCGKHYQAQRTTGSPMRSRKYTAPASSSDLRLCTVESCGRPHKARGYCDTHYARWQQSGDPGPAITEMRQSNLGQTCSGPECDRPAHSRGMCGSHYYQWRNGLRLAPITQYAEKGVPCAVINCVLPSVSWGYCGTHYKRQLANESDWDRPVAPKAPNGTGWVDEHGYRYVTVDGKQRREHIYLFEQVLGRRVRTEIGENVHHKNTVRSDNRTDGPPRMTAEGKLLSGNLELWVQAQPPGGEVGPIMDWATKMVHDYGAELDEARWAALEAAFASTQERRVHGVALVVDEHETTQADLDALDEEVSA